MNERCGKPMRYYRLNRYRDYDPSPACGRMAAHRGQCLTAEVLRQAAERVRKWRQDVEGNRRLCPAEGTQVYPAGT